jgi:hypothetical protein
LQVPPPPLPRHQTRPAHAAGVLALQTTGSEAAPGLLVSNLMVSRALCPAQEPLRQGRDLHLVEMFAGSASLTRAWRDGGFRATPFDNVADAGARGPHDVLSTRGFMCAVQLTRRLLPGGLLMGGPPCRSWTPL